MIAVRLDRRIAARVDPSDVLQETLAEAAVSLSDYLRRRPLPFYPWLRQIASERLIALQRRHVLAAARSVGREERNWPGLPDESALDLAERLISRDDSPSRQAARAEARSLVRETIDQLSPTDREVLVLRHLEGLETSEIATLLGISADAVRARHVRAIEQLRRRIGHLEERDSS
jgi:RNA polymerase sigma-70 factor (ECF subfamily)